MRNLARFSQRVSSEETLIWGMLHHIKDVGFLVFHVILWLVRRVDACIRIWTLKTWASVMESTSNLNFRRKFTIKILVGCFVFWTPICNKTSVKLFFERTKVRTFKLTAVYISELVEGVIEYPRLFLVPRDSFSDQLGFNFLCNSNYANVFPSS